MLTRKLVERFASANPAVMADKLTREELQQVAKAFGTTCNAPTKIALAIKVNEAATDFLQNT